MVRRKSLTSTEIKKMIKAKDLIIGTKRTIKNLKLGKIDKVIISSNCTDAVINDLKHYTSLSKTESIRVNYPNDELGVICKKPFSISVLAILKGVQ